MSVNAPGQSKLVSLIHDAQTIEELAYWDMFSAAPAAYAHEHQLRTERLSGGTCFAHRSLPVSLFNRVLKFGTSTPVTKRSLEEIQDWLQRYANPTHNIGVDANTQPEHVADWLNASGLSVSGGGIARFWYNKSLPASPVESSLTVREVSDDEREVAGELIRRAFGFPQGFEKWIGHLAGRPDWHVYFACDGETPVGVGAMYIKDEMAWLGVGATLGEHRGRGAQSLLLDRRVQDALKMGATSIHVETGHPGIGETIGQSYRNILKAGFEVLFVRDQYMPQPAS